MSRSLPLWIASLAFAAALLAAGCEGPSIRSVCDDLEASCPGTGADCMEDGGDLADQASELDCDEVFDRYLECIDAVGCDWRIGCVAQRDALHRCAGAFPD